MQPKDIAQLAAKPVPRYTSYPTAPHFHTGIGPATYGDWLEAVSPGARLSLYMHIPFCDTLCWFCGCQTRITQRYEPVGLYLGGLQREIAMVGERLPRDSAVSHIHWGGGSPTLLTPEDILRLADATRSAFTLSEDCEFAIEVDPRGMDTARIDALVASGLTRVSIGVQDFDPDVQRAINREQSFEETRKVAEAFRARGVASLNIDAIYGLPSQTRARLLATLEQVVALRPERIALFGYAHVPWMKKHQQLIDTSALPGVDERFAQAEDAARFLVSLGYVRIGIDHFALPQDALAIAARNHVLKRNFQGYTVDPADVLIGLGASSIGAMPGGYVQNEATTGRYLARIAEGRLATTRGIALNDDDRLRRAIIEELMCHLRLDHTLLDGLPGDATAKEAIRADLAAMVAEETRGWIVSTDEGIRVAEAGRPFLRMIAARLDVYLERSAGRHSVAV